MEGQKQTIWSERVVAGRSGYFLDVRETDKGRVFLSMAQSRKMDDGAWRRDRIVVFEGGLDPFRKALMAALEILDREAGDRRRNGIDEVRRDHPKAFEKWTPDDDALLKRLSDEGCDPASMAVALGRTERAVRMRLEGRDAVLASEGHKAPEAGAGEVRAEPAPADVSPGPVSPSSSGGRRKAASTPPPR